MSLEIWTKAKRHSHTATLQSKVSF